MQYHNEKSDEFENFDFENTENENLSDEELSPHTNGTFYLGNYDVDREEFGWQPPQKCSTN